MTTLNSFVAQVEILLGPVDSNTELTDAQLQAMVKAAVERYSRDSPNSTTTDITGDGGKYYDIATLLTSWIEGYSHVTTVEYPAENVSADTDPTYLGPDDWQDNYWYYGDRYLYLPNHAPAATETVRVTYNSPYVWSGVPEATTTPAADFYAISQLAAGYACQAIATKYSRTSDATITADSASHSSRASEFAARARDYMRLYDRHMGIISDDGQPIAQPAGDFIDWDTAPSWPAGRQYLYHGRNTR